jgi:hypothetical protein
MAGVKADLLGVIRWFDVKPLTWMSEGTVLQMFRRASRAWNPRPNRDQIEINWNSTAVPPRRKSGRREILQVLITGNVKFIASKLTLLGQNQSGDLRPRVQQVSSVGVPIVPTSGNLFHNLLRHRSASTLRENREVFVIFQPFTDLLQSDRPSARARTDPPVLAKNDPDRL